MVVPRTRTDIRANMRALRIHCGVTGEELGELIGRARARLDDRTSWKPVARAQVSSWERPTEPPAGRKRRSERPYIPGKLFSATLIEELAVALNLDVIAVCRALWTGKMPALPADYAAKLMPWRFITVEEAESRRRGPEPL